jgi:hypothetical protein
VLTCKGSDIILLCHVLFRIPASVEFSRIPASVELSIKLVCVLFDHLHLVKIMPLNYKSIDAQAEGRGHS